MAISSIVLTICACLSSGAKQIADDQLISDIQEKAVSIVSEAADAFDYDGFVYDEDEIESAVKNKLREANEENGLIAEDYALALDAALDADSNFDPDVDLDENI